MICLVLAAGMLDLVQDLGRPGYARFGVPQGGAADPGALIQANRLVGNSLQAAGLELVLRGPALAFPEGGVVALTGADMAAVRDSGLAAPRYQTLWLHPGEVLRLGTVRGGCRAYVGVGGGIATEPVMQSRATFTAGGFGGFAGRPLRPGDRLPLGPPPFPPPYARLPLPAPEDDRVVRVIPGPQGSAFDDSALVHFYGGEFRVSGSSDRAGLRLEGPRLRAPGGGRGPSQALLPGAVQVPPDGRPILLAWDGPVTGGYPVIAGVISADLPRLAQLAPGGRISFRAVSLEEARAAWQARLAQWETQLEWL